MSELIRFLIEYPDAEYFTDRLVAYDSNDNQIDILDDLRWHIQDYFESSRDNTEGILGIEIVDRLGGYRYAFDEIKQDINI